MKRILIVPVNYNSYGSLESFLDSIAAAWAEAGGEVEITLHIADNSTERGDYKIPQRISGYVKATELDNIGYFGAALKIINELEDTSAYDYVIISNVDVEVSRDFFRKLAALKTNPETGIIAPAILSEAEGRDRNPKIISRPSLKKMKLLKLMFTYPMLHRMYVKTLYKRKKLESHQPGEIYAAHGSFVILTHSFFKKINNPRYPIFLFGEEIWLGELCRRNGLKTLYIPELKVKDMEHVSTSSMKSKTYYRCNREALSYLIKTFYE